MYVVVGRENKRHALVFINMLYIQGMLDANLYDILGELNSS